MPRTVKLILLRLGVVLGAGAAVLLAAVAWVLYRPESLRPLILRALTPAGGTASVSRLSLALFPPALVLDGFSAAGPRPEDDALAIGHLSVLFAPARVLGDGAWIRRLEVRGLRFERRRATEGAGPLDLKPLAWLFRLGELDAADVRLSYATARGEVRIEAGRLSLAPAGAGRRRFRGTAAATVRRGPSLFVGEVAADGSVSAGPVLEATLSTEGGRLALVPVSGELSGRGALRLTKRRLEAKELELGLADARLEGRGGARQPLGRVGLRVAGGVDLGGREPRLEVGTLEVAGLLKARGRLGGPSRGELAGALEGELLDPSRAWALLASSVRAKLPSAVLGGTLPFRWRLEAGGRRPAAAAVELFPRGLEVELPGWGVGVRAAGWLRAAGPLEAWSRGRLALGGELDLLGRWRRGALEVKGFRLVTRVAGELSAVSLPGAAASIAAGALAYEGRPLPLGTVEVRAEAVQAPGRTSLRVLELTSGTVGRITGELGFGRGGLRGRVEGKRLSFPALLALGGRLRGGNWSRWGSSGEVDAAAVVEPAGGETALRASADLRALGFSSPSGDLMGQNVGGRLSVEVRPVRGLRLRAEFASAGGEALWGTAYTDLEKDPLAVRLTATRLGPDRYEDLSFEGTLGGFGRVSLGGRAERRGAEWRHEGRFALTEGDLARLFATFVRDPLAVSSPSLATLDASGTAAAELSVSGRGRTADLRGRISIRSGTLGPKDGAPLVSDLHVDLPVSYVLREGGPGGKGTRAGASGAGAPEGRLRVRAFRVPGGTAGPLELGVTLVPNRLLVAGEVDVPLYGGRLTLRRIEVREPLSPRWEAKAEATLADFDLGRLPAGGGLLDGRLGGHLTQVRLTREALTSTGVLTGDLLGGRLEVRNASLERPFGAGREWGADVELTLFDLERLSEGLEVGRVTGRASATATGLRVAYGQPVAFHLRLESVPVKGVPRRVSLTAVNSISVLGTGAPLGGVGLSLLRTFFREFPYARIGFESTLRNDVFTVRGLIREGGVEYLVKRPLLSGINVVNRNPDNRISFKDMVDRLKRVTGKKAGAKPAP